MANVPRDVSNGEHWLAGELLTRSPSHVHTQVRSLSVVVSLPIPYPNLGSLLLLIQSWKVKVFLKSYAWPFSLDALLSHCFLGSSVCVSLS